jgi:hypothetical protein
MVGEKRSKQKRRKFYESTTRHLKSKAGYIVYQSNKHRFESNHGPVSGTSPVDKYSPAEEN